MLSQELGLTPEQKEKLRTKLEAQMKANEAAMKSQREAGAKRMQALAAAFEADKFDAKKAGVGAQAPDMVKEMSKHHLEFVQTVLSVLTPEQRPKFAEHIKARAAAMFDHSAHADDDDD
jgi:Spy/CpxP family protein refolding chaperone